MNSPQQISYYNSTVTTAHHPKVIIVVLDGLRYDYTKINEDMDEFLESADVQPHSKLFKIRAQLPSMSVPNWMTILSGAPPESTGVMGNLLIPETPFDTIFREAANFEIQRGLTGSPWFSAIIKSTLPFLGGDGTIATTLGGRGHSSDAADDARADVIKQAFTSPLGYKLFLAHFSDIDIQGHCCGIDIKWNKEDSYLNAVTNKTRILSDIVQWVDNDTVVFVIADHGHVMRGGHGGTDPILTEIPLIIYKKDSNFKYITSSSKV
jgi:predicted AlkP superfamily pyrophosphatase or phosphodiesterase